MVCCSAIEWKGEDDSHRMLLVPIPVHNHLQYRIIHDCDRRPRQTNFNSIPFKVRNSILRIGILFRYQGWVDSSYILSMILPGVVYGLFFEMWSYKTLDNPIVDM